MQYIRQIGEVCVDFYSIADCFMEPIGLEQF